MFIIQPWQASLATLWKSPKRNIRVKGHSRNIGCRWILYGYMSHNWPWNIPDFEGPGTPRPRHRCLASCSKAHSSWLQSWSMWLQVRRARHMQQCGHWTERRQKAGTERHKEPGTAFPLLRVSPALFYLSLSLMSVEGASLFKSGQRAHEFNQLNGRKQLVFLHFPSVPNVRLAHEMCKFW